MEDEDARRGAAVGAHRRAVDDRRGNGASFLADVEQALAPTLFAGEMVVMDNVRTHKVAGVQEAIDENGAKIVYLPHYSPDFNPIEKPFSKIKSILRRIAARVVEMLETTVGEALQSFTPQEYMNYFASSGYDAAQSDSALDWIERRRSGLKTWNIRNANLAFL